jgi:DNA-binding MarR family transcriptional regulator
MVAEGARSRSDGAALPPGRGAKVRPAAEVTDSNPVGFDQLIHGRVRLGIVSALAVEESLSFNELKERLETSDGNLSVHARRLEEAGYLEVTKSFERRIPRTDFRLTDAGRKALERYLDHMEALIERVRE